VRLLPKEDIIIDPSYDGVHVIACVYEHPDGVRWWDKYHLSDLPNGLISRDDLERFGISLVDPHPPSSEETH
jgi:hypothetical protein